MSILPGTISLTIDNLRACASWIRDVLDPVVAREGPEILHPNDVLILHDLFVRLTLSSEISYHMLRASRIHCAIIEISGKATRWPGRLCDECDAVITFWKRRWGDDFPKSGLRPNLWGASGRLHGVVGKGVDLTKKGLLKWWRENCPDAVNDRHAYHHGDLGFKAGQWWINGLFAFQAGIVDLRSIYGEVCYDEKGAYAIVLKDGAEVEGSSPDKFTYRCKSNDKGRFKLTSADFKSRVPVRVLRSHDLSSFWAPRLGIRYEGLHRVVGWSIRGQDSDKTEGDLIWEIHFERDRFEQVSMEEVLRHPLANEVDDYMEYKLRRREQRDKLGEIATRKLQQGNPTEPLTETQDAIESDSERMPSILLDPLAIGPLGTNSMLTNPQGPYIVDVMKTSSNSPNSSPTKSKFMEIDISTPLPAITKSFVDPEYPIEFRKQPHLLPFLTASTRISPPSEVHLSKPITQKSITPADSSSLVSFRKSSFSREERNQRAQLEPGSIRSYQPFTNVMLDEVKTHNELQAEHKKQSQRPRRDTLFLNPLAPLQGRLRKLSILSSSSGREARYPPQNNLDGANDNSSLNDWQAVVSKINNEFELPPLDSPDCPLVKPTADEIEISGCGENTRDTKKDLYHLIQSTLLHVIAEGRGIKIDTKSTAHETKTERPAATPNQSHYADDGDSADAEQPLIPTMPAQTTRYRCPSRSERDFD